MHIRHKEGGALIDDSHYYVSLNNGALREALEEAIAESRKPNPDPAIDDVLKTIIDAVFRWVRD